MKKVFFVTLLSIGFLSCKKDPKIIHHPCYDASIVHDGPCPTDCPGVKGCDEKTYCNGCEAARNGIRVKNK